MIIVTTFFLILVLVLAGYFMYRAYFLAGLLAEAQEYIEELETTNEFMYSKIEDSYNTMQEVDRLGSFEAEDEVGTTFQMLKETITELKDLFNGEAQEKN
jgi:hypothetical protein